MPLQHTRTLEAFDSEGRRFLIHEYVSIIDASTLDNPRATVEGLKTYRTSSGGAVNKVGENQFEIVGAGVRVMVIRPKPLSD